MITSLNGFILISLIQFQEFRKSVIDEFGSVRTLSPEASRKQSSEVYLIAKRKKRR